MKMEIISTDLAPKAIGPYSQGVKAGGCSFFPAPSRSIR